MAMIKRIVTLLITAVILFVIFKLINVQSFLQALAHPNWPNLAMALFLFIPLIGLTAFRWGILVHKSCHCPLWESTKLLLASNTLNLVLPSKMGDLCKGLFLRNTGKVDLSRGMNIVIFEKLIDFCSLGVVFLTGYFLHTRTDNPITQKMDFVCLAFIVFVIAVTSIIYFVPLRLVPGYLTAIRWMEGKKGLSKIGYFLEDGQKLMGAIRESNWQIVSILGLSIFLWFMHMTQVYFFFRAVDVTPSLVTVYHWAPMAILVGLIPVTISGIGIRDGSFMFLFSSYGTQAVLFAASVLVTLRYIIPGLAGTLFLNEYLTREKLQPNSK